MVGVAVGSDFVGESVGSVGADVVGDDVGADVVGLRVGAMTGDGVGGNVLRAVKHRALLQLVGSESVECGARK